MFTVSSVSAELQFVVVDVPIALLGTDHEQRIFRSSAAALGVDHRLLRRIAAPTQEQVAHAFAGLRRHARGVEIVDGPGLVFDVSHGTTRARRVKLHLYAPLRN